MRKGRNGGKPTPIRAAKQLWRRPAAGTLVAIGLLACGPEGPPTGRDAPQTSKPASSNRRTIPATQKDPLLTLPFKDDFERRAVGKDWRTLGNAWRIEDGQLCAQGAKNRGAWLKRRLPTNARIEFDAQSASPDGDLKAEAWGDGHSGATAVSYTDATSYLTIFGGWKNRIHVLARIDEHGKDRLEVHVKPASDDPRERKVEPGQLYRFKIERTDGKTIAWWVDDVLMHELADPEPLRGEGHDHFGFNNWAVPVCFDNLEVTPL